MLPAENTAMTQLNSRESRGSYPSNAEATGHRRLSGSRYRGPLSGLALCSIPKHGRFAEFCWFLRV